MYDAATQKREDRQRLIHDLEWFAGHMEERARALGPLQDALARAPRYPGIQYAHTANNALVGVSQRDSALEQRLRWAFSQAEAAENEGRSYERSAGRLQYAIEQYRRAAQEARAEASRLRALR